jgi:hypothetical protein
MQQAGIMAISLSESASSFRFLDSLGQAQVQMRDSSLAIDINWAWTSCSSNRFNHMNSKNTLSLIGLTTITLMLTACDQEQAEVPQSSETPQQVETKDPVTTPKVKQPVQLTRLDDAERLKANKAKETLMTVTGTMKFMSFEGGFYGIVTDKGQKLLPLNLKAEYRQDGMKLKVTGKIETEVMTIQQWGTPFTIESVEVLAPGKKGASNLM